MTDHTDAPWHVERESRYPGWLYKIVSDSGTVITHWMGYRPKTAEHNANALLIAAAPDLLAVCQQIENFYPRILEGLLAEDFHESTAIHEQLEAAINKTKVRA